MSTLLPLTVTTTPDNQTRSNSHQEADADAVTAFNAGMESDSPAAEVSGPDAPVDPEVAREWGMIAVRQIVEDMVMDMVMEQLNNPHLAEEELGLKEKDI